VDPDAVDVGMASEVDDAAGVGPLPLGKLSVALRDRDVASVANMRAAYKQLRLEAQLEARGGGGGVLASESDDEAPEGEGVDGGMGVGGGPFVEPEDTSWFYAWLRTAQVCDTCGGARIWPVPYSHGYCSYPLHGCVVLIIRSKYCACSWKYTVKCSPTRASTD
jgi:hypothetical protein